MIDTGVGSHDNHKDGDDRDGHHNINIDNGDAEDDDDDNDDNNYDDDDDADE